MRLVVSGGGTGGHLFPGLAVARGVEQRLASAEVLFITTARAMDQEILRRSGLSTAVIRCSGIKGAGYPAKVRSLLRQPLAVFQALSLLRGFRAELVLGVGGYVTGPVLLAAKLLGLPTCIHEQNSVPGLANKLAGRLADRICTSIPCGEVFPAARTVLTGNPVREQILALAGREREEHDPPVLLVLGGSQGAHRVNQLVVEAVAELVQRGLRPRMIHQTGEMDHALVKEAYQGLGLEAEVQPFFTDMAALYAAADMAISRAGATTLAELAVVGLPALLVPYPYAADDHQWFNGLHYAGSGGCLLKREEELSGTGMADLLEPCLRDQATLEQMAASMGQQGIPEATERIVDQCVELLSRRS
ncbi:undecaprenyldiphospho-muramoylpentapeptide beta-N-acetylglucosaminyltransferase [Desulfogranum mediterraneum]|uniref:undecaprenyldiphospho-muramoylpentapeptide beta-N-acetylglucosaminyltransferase n=1 Tax=Desulfogranum mediterraneum TaxID=160661 RepID=UPI0003F943A4|nr:undecaprenyldiphospho-muramoylpentapeptide beta-N-acetylglucosaminyltransferase [Desulfogranum mediterraneum]